MGIGSELTILYHKAQCGFNVCQGTHLMMWKQRFTK